MKQIWDALRAHSERLAKVPTRDLFASDAGRLEHFSAEGANLYYDFSRQRIDAPALQDLIDLARKSGLTERREAMWRGDAINATENRAVLHVALRQPQGAGIGGADIEREVLAERERVLAFAENVRKGMIAGSSGKKFSLVINIGIGGSDLGPAMAVLALKEYTDGGPRCQFVSNVDGCHLMDLLEKADPHSTLFIVASKTFTTLETLTNARTARTWIQEQLGDRAVPAHFAAVSVNHRAMDEFGIHPEYRFKMWDWVGGRYSLWSAIGTSIAIAIGRENFLAFLAGAYAMDEHFRTAPLDKNLPALMGLTGVWNINLQKLPTLAVLPYDERLARFPAYLQQLEMESNGKSVTMDGERVHWDTAAVIWGEPGNNAQHSFFQLLHQGTPRAALDFLLPAQSSCGDQEHQNLAIANCIAQAQAFMIGQSEATVRAELAPQNLPEDRLKLLVAHKVHEGNRPSNLVLFAKLDPKTLGALIALYEHKVFTQSVIWQINAFDQWGVELGKKLAEQLIPAVKDPEGAKDVSAPVKELLLRIEELSRESHR